MGLINVALWQNWFLSKGIYPAKIKLITVNNVKGFQVSWHSGKL